MKIGVPLFSNRQQFVIFLRNLNDDVMYDDLNSNCPEHVLHISYKFMLFLQETTAYTLPLQSGWAPSSCNDIILHVCIFLGLYHDNGPEPKLDYNFRRTMMGIETVHTLYEIIIII